MNAESRQQVINGKRWVVKIGSALLTNNGQGLHREAMASWVEQLAELAAAGYQLVLVSSGAVAVGMTTLGWNKRPTSVEQLQAAAAVGQMGLVRTYEDLFGAYKIHTAQILLVNDDLADRKRYLNARSTLNTLIDLGVLPVVNENDTVATDEIRFGDNDTLAAMVANLIDADGLIIMTDQQGLYDADPRSNADAQLVSEAYADDPALRAMAGESMGALGRGGMVTKLRAARLAARSGTATIIAGGSQPNILRQIFAGEKVGTCLHARQQPIAARKQWLAGQLKSAGRVVLDRGAVESVRRDGRSLLPVGVVSVAGDFGRGELVECLDEDGVLVAKGLINYGADDARRIMRRSTREIADILGFEGDKELVHRDNLVLVE